MRHSRALRKHIERLVEAGQIERVAVGEGKTICIRLVKYNTEASTVMVHPVPPSSTVQSGLPEEPKLDLEGESVKLPVDIVANGGSAITSGPAYSPTSGVALSLSFEYLIAEIVVNSGVDGATLNVSG